MAAGGEAGAQFRERVGRKHGVGLARLQVVAGVVGGVAAQAQRVRLDQQRAAGAVDLVDGGGERLERGGDVRGAVEGEALDAVAGGAAPELEPGGVLLADRRRVGVAVVLDDEEDRQVEQRGEVERLVHVARAAGAVADEGKAHGRPAETPLRVEGADHVRHHDAEMADHRQ